jgi:predicted DCC family thiol-disulfide oxidoreductase YuxK
VASSHDITVVFDTDCILCSHWVRFILRNEVSDNIRFASSRKPVGQSLAVQYGLSPEELDLTYLVVDRGQALLKSDASLALLGELKKPWPWFRVLRFVPRRVRDWLYDLVARNRLRWFGEQKDCFLPTSEQRGRFLD